MGKILFDVSDYRFSAAALASSGSTVLAVAAKCSANIDSGAKWGYSELVGRISTDGGNEWQEQFTIAAPPARWITADRDNSKTAFFINPVLATAKNGDFVLLFTMFPESKGADDKKLLEKKKITLTSFNGTPCPVIYDRDGKFYTVLDDGKVLDSSKSPTDYIVKGVGNLYSGDEYLGNIYLNGAKGKSDEEGDITSFGAPLKAAKRSYIFAMTSADGVNWSEPRDITPCVLSDKDGATAGTDAGNAAVTQSGRIIVPLMTESGAASIYSDDNGLTWTRNQRMPYMGAKKAVTAVQTPSGEILALGKKSCISVDNGITWGSYKSKFAPTKAIAIGERIFTVINSKVGTVLIGGEFVYGKKNKFKGIAYSKENSEVAGGLLPYTTLAEVGGKPAALYITPDNKQVSFTTL